MEYIKLIDMYIEQRTTQEHACDITKLILERTGPMATAPAHSPRPRV